MRSSWADLRGLAPARGRARVRAAARGTSPGAAVAQRADAPTGATRGPGSGAAARAGAPDRRGTATAVAVDPDDARLLGPWARLVLGTLLVGAALLGPAVGYASAQFGSTATVTISITVPPESPAPTTTAAPSATLDAPSDLP